MEFARRVHRHVYFTDIPPRERLGTAKLFMVVARNDVTVNITGGATCNNSKQSLVIKMVHICHNIASTAMNPVLNGP